LGRTKNGTGMTKNANRLIQLPEGVDDNWDRTIGGFILNCGAIEFALIRLAEVISQDPVQRDLALKKMLSGRISLVRGLAQRSNLSDSVRQELENTLDKVAELAETRNTVAHNPFVSGVDAKGVPVKGIMDVRKVKGIGPFEVGLLGLQDILSGAHRAGDLVQSLQRTIVQIDQERDSPNPSAHTTA